MAELLALKWNTHSATFLHVLSNLRNKECFCDATIACDGGVYPVHKLVLSSCSEYFYQIFKITPCKHPIIILKGVERNDMESLLNFMYVGHVNIEQDKLGNLIAAAEMLKVKGLMNSSQKFDSFDNKDKKRNIEEISTSSPSKVKKRRTINDTEDVLSVSTTSEEDAFDDNLNPRVKKEGGKFDPSPDHKMEDIEKINNVKKSGQLCDNIETSQNKPKINSFTKNSYTKENEDKELIQMIETEKGVDNETLNSFSNSQTKGNLVHESIDVNEIPSTSCVNEESILQKDESEDKTMESATDPECTENCVEEEEFCHARVEINDNEEMETSFNAFLKCILCPEMFSSHTALFVHLSNHSAHTSANIFQCPQCPYSTIYNSNLRTHVRLHAGENLPFVCPHCSFKVTEKREYDAHVRIHTGDKSYSCPHCSFKATEKREYDAHVRIHTGDKSYSCPHCPFQTVWKKCLDGHIHTHTGEKPYRCPHCLFVTGQRPSLSRHIKTHFRDGI